jgi:hypothetical protein
MRQLNDEAKPVHKVGFIREKGKAIQLEHFSGDRKPLAHCSSKGWGFYGHFNSGLGEGFSLAVDFMGFLR